MQRRSNSASAESAVIRPECGPSRSGGCWSAPRADPSRRRPRSGATRSTSAYRFGGPRRHAPGPGDGQAPCRRWYLPLGRPSPSRTSQAACPARLGGDPGAVRCGARLWAASAARAAQQPREPSAMRLRACVLPADRPRGGLDIRRTRRLAPAQPGGRSRTDAIRDRCGRRRSGGRRFLSRSGLRQSSALARRDRPSVVPWP